MQIQFEGYNLFYQPLRSDESGRITIDIGQDQLEAVKDILLKKVPKGVFKITIEPLIENN